MSDDERHGSVDMGNEEGKTETQLRMEAEAKRRQERDEEEWKEYNEARQVEKEKEAKEIQELRERRERRKVERAEEEKRLAELRAVEEQKRRAEEEERQRKKREEAEKKKLEREARKKENEERSKKSNQPNFVINKRAGAGAPQDEENATSDVPQKSKEQIEAERNAALAQRIVPLSIDGFGADQLKEMARKLHKHIYDLESDKYDLQQQFEQQNMDMMELAERARQISKGGKTGQKVNNMCADDAKDSKKSRAPPKVVMYSQYERVQDQRSFGDRKTVFNGPQFVDEFTRIMPESKIEMGDQGAKVIGSYELTNGTAHPENSENVDPSATNGEA